MIVLLVQFIVALFFVYGLLFAKTALQSYIVLIGLVLLFLFKRYLQEFSGCSQLTELLKEFCLQKEQEQSQDKEQEQSQDQEQLVLGTAVILAIARTAVITLKLHNVVF